MKKLVLLAGIFLLIGLSLPLIRAHIHHNQVVYHSSGVALEGYDVVSYFTQPLAQKGKEQITSSYAGLTYLFSKEEHKKLFEENPESYLPQYGAWCATAMASGKRVRPIPTNYEVRDGKLYLFYEFLGMNPKKKWEKSVDSYRIDANRSYAQLIKSH